MGYVVSVLNSKKSNELDSLNVILVKGVAVVTIVNGMAAG